MAKAKFRAELVFNEDAFIDSNNGDTLIMASDRGAISALEEINMTRKKLGLDPVTQSDPLVKEAEKMRKARIEALVNPPQPGSKKPGGSSEKKRKSSEGKSAEKKPKDKEKEKKKKTDKSKS